LILLYNIALLIFSIFLFPWLLYRSLVKEKYRLGIRQRLGFYPKEVLEKRSGKRLIWIQAVSVGEALAVNPLIAGIRKRFPGYQILISTTTLTGYKICNEKVAQSDDIAIFFPLDYYWTVKKALCLFKPSLILLVETEIWPNFVCVASRKGIPVMMVNGRISDKSFKGYSRLRWLMRIVLSKISWFGMQGAKDAERIIALGAESYKVAVTSSLKYEGAIELAGRKYDKQAIRDELRMPKDSFLITGGSTHPGEEDILINVYLGLKQEFPNIVLLLAPRHPHRVPQIEEYLRTHEISYNLRSKLSQKNTEFKPVVILDTLGELIKYYIVSTVVFIGKSLCGKGGQNPMEPAALAKPVIFGPNMSNFSESSELLIMSKAAIMVENEVELTAEMARFLRNPEIAKRMGENGAAAIMAKKGAVDEILDSIGKILP
jgi:3-deoxy-D-manno-octulosonic-acid transferase